MRVNFEAPINFTSIGQTSYNIFKELVKISKVSLRPINFSKPNVFCIKAFEPTPEEHSLLSQAVQDFHTEYDRNDPTLMIYHIAGSETSMGKEQSLFTFHETDRLTPFEVNRLSQKKTIFVSSKYTKEIFDSHLSGVPVVYCPLGFDSQSFQRIEKEEGDVITFGIRGKMEHRKNTLRVIKAWAKTFGGDPRYRLDCSIHNAFINESEQTALILKSMPDKCIPWNINFLPFCESNFVYNKVLNNADIDLTGMSGCEGFNLPLFQSLCLGKQAIVLNAHVHKDFCNESNSILVEPKGTVVANDGRFFFSGSHTSQGDWFDFRDKDLIDAMVFAAEKGAARNTEGEKLKEWTFEKTAKIISENL